MHVHYTCFLDSSGGVLCALISFFLFFFFFFFWFFFKLSLLWYGAIIPRSCLARDCEFLNHPCTFLGAVFFSSLVGGIIIRSMGFQNGFVWRFNIILLFFLDLILSFFLPLLILDYTFYMFPFGMVHWELSLAIIQPSPSHSIIHVAPSRSPTEVLLDPQGWNWDWNWKLTVNRILVPTRRKKNSILVSTRNWQMQLPEWFMFCQPEPGHKIDSPDPVLSFPHDDTRWLFPEAFTFYKVYWILQSYQGSLFLLGRLLRRTSRASEEYISIRAIIHPRRFTLFVVLRDTCSKRHLLFLVFHNT